MDGPVVVTPKAVDIQAWEITNDNIQRVARWCGAKVLGGNGVGKSNRPHLVMFDDDGDDNWGEVGDWVVEGDNKHFFVAPNEWFQRTYRVKHSLPYRVEARLSPSGPSSSGVWWVDVPVLGLAEPVGKWEDVEPVAKALIASALDCSPQQVAIEVHTVVKG